MRRTRLSLCAGLAAVTLVAGAAPAAAAPPPPATETVDLALVAEARGWTLAQARADRDVTDRLGRVQQELAARAPEAFLGGVLASTPGGTPTILVKGTADAVVRQIVADAGIAIKIVDGRPYSLADLSERATLLHKQLSILGYRDFSTAVDVTAGRVVGAVTARSGLPSSLSALTARLPARLRTGVQLSVVDQPVGRLSAAFGGMVVSGASGWCTSGWPVRHNATGQTGVTIAGHCEGINRITDPGPEPDVSISFPLMAEHRGTWGDVQWHTTVSPGPDDFYASAGEIRDVALVEPQTGIAVGESVCVYGRASNVRGCDTTVTFPVSSCTLGGFTYGQLTAMSGAGTIAAGDSGGGWSFNNTAYGSTLGWCQFGDGIGRAMWSSADRYDEALGVSVRTF